METLLIPHADTIPVTWGWFQFLLLLTFPLHIIAMNCMLGGLILGVFQHIRGGELRVQLAHRIAVVLPLIIATVVNLGVAPYLFLQVLYGQFLYTSSVLMALAWIMIIPILIVAYYGAYFYDFRFVQLGKAGPWIGVAVSILLLIIGWFFSNNMQLMVLPERFEDYFTHMNGSLLVTDYSSLLPRYLHMVFGTLAIGGLFIALLGRFKAAQNGDLAKHALGYGMQSFLIFTLINIFIGLWYFLSLPKEMMHLFLGGNGSATATFILGMLLLAGGLVSAVKRRLWLTINHALALVLVMTFMRSWLRSEYLSNIFSLDQLQVVPQYSPMIFFFATLVFGIICLIWLLRKTTKVLL
jgi:hypothetical protein